LQLKPVSCSDTIVQGIVSTFPLMNLVAGDNEIIGNFSIIIKVVSYSVIIAEPWFSLLRVVRNSRSPSL
jgi:hypothetical protein